MSAGIREAIEIAAEAHRDQTDKGGKPYICHPLYVASQQSTEDGIIVALLHDTVEDSPVTLDDLRTAGFSDAVIEALRLLTHQNDVSYSDYITAIKGNELARQVKLADLRHNSDLSRLSKITEKDLARAEKYLRAIEFLSR
ncbi:MAG: HD domain-containing protein [Ruminococcaceae bacterium]|nr:HD domain-containing protein [Oscillospiraceae bacterium]